MERVNSMYVCADCGKRVDEVTSVQDHYVCKNCVEDYERAREDAFAAMLPPVVQAILDDDYAKGIGGSYADG